MCCKMWARVSADSQKKRGGGAYVGWRMRTAESPADYTSRGWNDNIRGRTNWIQRTLDWQAGRPNMFHHRPLGQPRRAYGSTALQFSSGTVPCSEKYQRLCVWEREKKRGNEMDGSSAQWCQTRLTIVTKLYLSRSNVLDHVCQIHGQKINT